MRKRGITRSESLPYGVPAETSSGPASKTRSGPTGGLLHPMMSRRAQGPMQNLCPLILLVLLIALLFTLSTGINQLDLSKGGRLARSGTDAARLEGSSQATADAEGESPPVIVFLLLGGLILVGTIGLIVSKRMRRTFLTYLYGGMIFFGSFLLILLALSNLSFDPGDSSTAPVVTDLPPAPEAAPSSGQVRGVAIGLAVLVVGGVMFLILRFTGRSPKHTDAYSSIDDLLEPAAVAAARIRYGDDAKDAVIDCYRSMLSVLEKRGIHSSPSLTPREFAATLRGWGFPNAAAGRLTELFELVRYGHRSTPELADRALASLEAVVESRSPKEQPEAPK